MFAWLARLFRKKISREQEVLLRAKMMREGSVCPSCEAPAVYQWENFEKRIAAYQCTKCRILYTEPLPEVN